MDTLQAAILRVKLPYLKEYLTARRKAAAEYDKELKDLSDRIETPYCIPASTHVFHQYTLKVKDGQRDPLQQYLKEKGIPTMIYYPFPLQEQPAFKYSGRIGSDLSESVKLCRSVLSLPMHTELDEEQIEYIIEQIQNYEFK
ncbi:hypothetical protein FACS189428_6960 [Clostridia bacterium]|nr:hypothetical protein FACS189428_6960 [Clostridia bacterium]